MKTGTDFVILIRKSKAMNIQADINWIREEIKSIKDPNLIEAFKQLLQFRKKTQVFTIEDYNREIDEAEQRIEQGKFSTQKEVEERAKKW